MRIVALRPAGGRYRPGERVFGGVDEPEGTAFSPGPAMRCAKVDARRVRVFHRGRRLGAWRLPNARVVAWWDLPIVVRGGRVDLLRPGGRLRRLPLGGGGLVTVLPGRSGALFALYSTETHWRVLRLLRGTVRATPWTKGLATDCTATPDRLFVAAGSPGGAYKEYGAHGPGALWSYAFRDGAVQRQRDVGGDSELVFDDPWVRRDHVASLLRRRARPGVPAPSFPSLTEILVLGAPTRVFSTVPAGWEVHALDRGRRTFLGLRLDRGNMGFDLREVSLATGAQTPVAEDVDAVDVGAPSPYSPFVEG